MKPRRLASTVLACGLCLVSQAVTSAATFGLDAGAVARRAAAAQVPFIENEGQIDEESVRYYARLSSGTLFVTVDGDLVYSLDASCRKRWAFREAFVGGKPSRPVGSESSAIRVSRFEGNRPGEWRRQLRTFDRLDLGEVYPGIRVELKAAGNNVEKLLHLSPGAQPSAISTRP